MTTLKLQPTDSGIDIADLPEAKVKIFNKI